MNIKKVGTMTDKIKEKAAKMRSMSYNELVSYVENRVKKRIVRGLISVGS